MNESGQVNMTGVGINIVNSSGQNFTKSIRGSLKRQSVQNSPSSKKKTITIKEEFLPKRKRIIEVPYEHLYEHIKKSLPEDSVKHFTSKLYRSCYAYAKNTFMYTGNSVKKVEADKERQSQMNFIEVIVLLCLLANEFSKKANADEMQLKPTIDKIKEFFVIIMTAFQMKVEEVPPKDQDLRGLAIPEDILVDGKI